MFAYQRPQQWKKEESNRLRGEIDQIKFIFGQKLNFDVSNVLGWCYVRCILEFERSRNQRQGSEFFLEKWNL